MWNVSENFHQSFKSDYRQIYVRITINNKVYRNDDLTSFEYDGGSIVGDTFSIGSTYSNSLKIVFCEIVEGLKELDEVKLDIGIKYLQKCNCRIVDNQRICECKSGDYLDLLCGCETNNICGCTVLDGQSYCEVVEYCPMGVFLISEAVDIDRNENKTTVDCMDRMILLEGLYESKLSYPAPIREVALEIANLSGVRVNETSFARLSPNSISKPEGYTYRQTLGLIAQFQAGFVTFDREGLLDIRNLNTTDFKITPDEYYSKGLVKNDLKYTLGGVQAIIRNELDNNTLRAGSGSGSQIVLENNIMTQVLLDDIYHRLKDLNYYPFTLNWRGNPALETGDWISMIDREGNSFYSLNLTYRLSFSGGLRAISSAETQSQASTLYQRRPGLNQVLDWVNGVIDKNGNATYFGSAIPNSPREGDIWFRPNGPDTEILIFAGGEWVLQLSSAMSEEIRQAIESAQEDAKRAVENANSAVREANEALDKAQVAFDQSSSAMNHADTAMSNANKAIQQANDAFDTASDAMGIAEGFSSRLAAAEGNASEALQTVNGFRNTVEDAYSNSSQALQTVEGFRQTVTDANNNSSQALQTVNGFETRIQSVEGEVSQALQTVDGFQQKVEDANNNSSLALQTVNGFETRVQGAENASSQALQTVEGFRQTVTDANNNSSQALQTANGLQQSVLGENGLSTQVTQLSSQWSTFINDDIDGVVTGIIADSKMIDMRIQQETEDGGVISNFINVSLDGLVLSGSQIVLDGRTIVTGEFVVGDANINSLDADKLTVGSTLNAANIDVINLNASNLVSGTLSADRVRGGTLRIDGGGGSFLTVANGELITYQAGGAEGTILSQASLRFRDVWRAGSPQVASLTRTVTSGTNNVSGVYLVAESGYSVSLGAPTASGGNLHPALRVDGTTGAMEVWNLHLRDHITTNGWGIRGAITFSGSGNVRIDSGKALEVQTIRSRSNPSVAHIDVRPVTLSGVIGLALGANGANIWFGNDGRMAIQKRGTWAWL